MVSSVLYEIIPFVILLVGILLVWRLSWLLLVVILKLSNRLYARPPGTALWIRVDTLRPTLAHRMPRTARFINNRLNPRQFNGLALTLIILAAIYVASLLGGLVEEVLEAEGLVRFDNAANEFFNPYRTPGAVAVFSWITDLGASACLSAVVFVATGLFWVHQRRYMIAPLWTSFAGALATTYAGKFALARERPEFLTEVTALTPSFPSGHATGAMAVYGFMAYAISRELSSARQRFEVAYWALILIGLTGFSRIFLSVHYTSDVAAGFLVGGFWLLVGLTGAEQLRRRSIGPRTGA